MRKLIHWGLLSFLILGIIAFTQKDKLPDPQDVSPLLLQEPVQTPTDKQPFNVKMKGENYTVKPMYAYTLYGLIVSNHVSSSWMDIAHDESKDYLNIMDDCVVYGDNVTSGVYQRLSFGHSDWTCTWQGSSKDYQGFQNHFISNNHILTENPEIAKAVLRARNGDQIYFKGYLVSYTSPRWNNFSRVSSITRDDTGGKACEVVYIDDFQILKAANPGWRFIYFFSKMGIVFLLGLLFWINYREAGEMIAAETGRK